MTKNTAYLQYRQAATRQASVVGLVIALHDTLIGNLRRAAQAIESNDIPARCSELIHGFKVLQQLEAMLDLENGGETAASVRRFYAHTRGQMLKAQFTLSAPLLWNQVQGVLEVRQAWHQLDSAPDEVRLPQERSSHAPDHAGSRHAREEVRVSFACEV